MYHIPNRIHNSYRFWNFRRNMLDMAVKLHFIIYHDHGYLHTGLSLRILMEELGAALEFNYFLFVFRIFKFIFNWGEIYPNDISIEVVSSIQNQIGIISFCRQIKISGNFTCFLISKLTGIKHTIIFRNPLKFLNQNVCCIF